MEGERHWALADGRLAPTNAAQVAESIDRHICAADRNETGGILAGKRTVL